MKEFVTVATFDFPTEAEIHKSLLERHGIRAFLADGNLVGTDWFVANAVGGVKLQVPAANGERAAKILETYRAAQTGARENPPEEEITFACHECGQSVTFSGDRCGHVEDCPHCGDYIDVPDQSDPALLPPPKTVKKPIPSTNLDSGSRTSRQLWIEVFAVLCLTYFPYLFNSLVAISGLDTAASSTFVCRQLYLIVRSLETAMPLLLILSLSKDSWSLFGIVRPAWITDILLACVICFSARMAYYFAMSLLPRAMLGWSASQYVSKPERMPAYFLMLVACIANAFAEELAMRGYLIPRLERLLRSTPGAVLVTSVLFGSYHLYQGITPAIGITVLGFVYAIAFCLCRRLWPLCLAHALQNFLLYI